MPDSRLCPPFIQMAFREWATRQIPAGNLGGFVRAVLENNLKEAVARADDVNVNALPHIVAYAYSYLPFGSWGSPEAVATWPIEREVSVPFTSELLDTEEERS